MNPYRIAFVPLARPTFDVPLAQEMTRVGRCQLLEAGFELVSPDGLVADMPGVQAFLQQLELEKEIDLLLVFQATFADSTLVTTLAQSALAPLFLWAIPETPTGGRLRLNSLCGINLAAHALSQRQLDYDYAYAQPDDPAVLSQVRALAAAGRVMRLLKAATVGVIGEHPAGMDSCHLDEQQLYEKLGIRTRQVPLNDFFTSVKAVPAANVDQVRVALAQHLDNLSELEQAPLEGTLKVFSALQSTSSQASMSGLAVRCWPEFFTELGCAACGAMSMLSDGFGGNPPVPCSCEADINGTITQLILYWLAGEPSFGTDIVSMDFEEDTIALWHCGLAPLSMANPGYQPHGTIHSNRKVPLVMEFPLKPGTVTLARLNRHQGDLRLVIGRGEMLDAPAPFSGTSGLLRMQKPARDFFDALMQEGLEHHVSLVYGDHVAALEILARLLGLPVLHL